MALADDVRALRDRVMADLTEAYDHYLHTIMAWDIVRKSVASGHTFVDRSVVTGTVTTETDLVAKAAEYVAIQLAESTFQQFISIFEAFFFDLLRLWLLAYPRSLGDKKVDFKAILDAPDKDAITLLVVNKELNDVLYERPAAWFAYLEDKAKLGCPTAAQIDQIAEAKATRDVLVHNRGVAGKSYVAKAGILARGQDGDRLDITEPYHRETWILLRTVADDICAASLAKLP